MHEKTLQALRESCQAMNESIHALEQLQAVHAQPAEVDPIRRVNDRLFEVDKQTCQTVADYTGRFGAAQAVLGAKPQLVSDVDIDRAPVDDLLTRLTQAVFSSELDGDVSRLRDRVLLAMAHYEKDCEEL